MSEQIITKQCPRCKEIKPLSEFYKDRRAQTGYHSWCKNCCKKYQQSTEGKTIQKRYMQSGKGKVTASKAQKKYAQTEKGKKLIKMRVKLRRKNNPEKNKARKAVSHAIRDGKLPQIASLQCSCGKQAVQYHHHKGYAPEHWLDVIPVCIKCHFKVCS